MAKRKMLGAFKGPKKPKNFRYASLATLQAYAQRFEIAKKAHQARVAEEKQRQSLIGRISGLGKTSTTGLFAPKKKKKAATTTKKKKTVKRKK